MVKEKKEKRCSECNEIVERIGNAKTCSLFCGNIREKKLNKIRLDKKKNSNS